MSRLIPPRPRWAEWLMVLLALLMFIIVAFIVGKLAS